MPRLWPHHRATDKIERMYMELAIGIAVSVFTFACGLMGTFLRRLSVRLDETNKQVGNLRVAVAGKVSSEWLNGKMDRISDELKEIRDRLPPKAQV